MIQWQQFIAKNKQIVFTVFTFCIINSYGQKTPQDLGKITFDIFKNENYSLLDTLTPTASEIIEIMKHKYSTTQIDTSVRFLKKLEYHDKKFKNKCKDIRNDTTEIKINWGNSSLTKIEFYEKPYPEQDSNINSNPILTNYLDIFFVSNSATYVLQFKGIYFNKGIWKLGEHVRIRKL